ncbi:MAG TPA: ATP-binding protein [Pseudonocardiaceae bacterium]|nr:ATP-binding protein [Pseudonocardiaceae bacterium]
MRVADDDQGAIADLRCDDTPAVSDQLARLRQALAGWASHVGVPADIVADVILAADEAMSNVVSHAYAGRPGTFDLHAVYTTDDIRVTVRDHGRWRPTARDQDPLHGRGLLLIRALADGVTVDHGPDGTTVSMVWSLHP